LASLIHCRIHAVESLLNNCYRSSVLFYRRSNEQVMHGMTLLEINRQNGKTVLMYAVYDMCSSTSADAKVRVHSCKYCTFIERITWDTPNAMSYAVVNCIRLHSSNFSKNLLHVHTTHPFLTHTSLGQNCAYYMRYFTAINILETNIICNLQRFLQKFM